MRNNLTLASPATHKNMPLLLAHMRGLAAAYRLIRTSVSKYGLTEPGKRNAADKLLADTGCSSLALSQGVRAHAIVSDALAARLEAACFKCTGRRVREPGPAEAAMRAAQGIFPVLFATPPF